VGVWWWEVGLHCDKIAVVDTKATLRLPLLHRFNKLLQVFWARERCGSYIEQVKSADQVAGGMAGFRVTDMFAATTRPTRVR
jgi:hypothetical protein